MGFLDRLLGREERPEDAAASGRTAPAYGTPPTRTQRTEDEIAIERYRYLLRTAPPEAIEQVHREAFEQLTPEQRAQVFRELSEGAPAGDAPRSDDPSALAQSATRSELRQPGFMERRFSGGGGMGFGGVLASSMLGTIAGFVIGSALAESLMPDSGEYASGDGDGGESGDSGADASADGGSDLGGGDYGGDAGGGDLGGDFGGGDFGGGFDF